MGYGTGNGRVTMPMASEKNWQITGMESFLVQHVFLIPMDI